LLLFGSLPGIANIGTFNLGPTNSITATSPIGTYYVRIVAANAAGQGPPSPERSFTTGGAPAPCQPLPIAYGSTISGSLTETDCNSARRAGSKADLYSFSVSAGTPITIAMTRGTLNDPFLFVVSPNGSVLAFDDDSGGDLNSLISAVAPVSGSYTAEATSYGSGDRGTYTLSVGAGLTITATWDARSDVDLHVVEPSGEEIYYGNPTSRSGGRLNRDANAGCGGDSSLSETVDWPSRSAPIGRYVVRLDYWGSCGVARTNYTVTINDGGAVTTYTGFFTGPGDGGSVGSGRTVATFTHGNAVTGSDDAAPIVTPMVIKARPNQR
jgi:hypothetical protein